jgi:hypothetical protein
MQWTPRRRRFLVSLSSAGALGFIGNRNSKAARTLGIELEERNLLLYSR